MPPTSFRGLFPNGDTCGWLGPRPQGFARVPFNHFQIVDLKYFRLATLMALFVSFCASLYQLPSRDFPRDEACMPRPRGHVFTVSLGLVTLVSKFPKFQLRLQTYLIDI